MDQYDITVAVECSKALYSVAHINPDLSLQKLNHNDHLTGSIFGSSYFGECVYSLLNIMYKC